MYFRDPTFGSPSRLILLLAQLLWWLLFSVIHKILQKKKPFNMTPHSTFKIHECFNISLGISNELFCEIYIMSESFFLYIEY